jgi:hypothetical protein
VGLCQPQTEDHRVSRYPSETCDGYSCVD